MLPKEEKQKIINNYLKEILQKSHIEFYYCLIRSKCKRVREYSYINPTSL